MALDASPNRAVALQAAQWPLEGKRRTSPFERVGTSARPSSWRVVTVEAAEAVARRSPHR